MIERYELEPLTEDEIDRWDDITAAYPNRELFHRRAWLNYLAEGYGLKIRYWTIRRRGERIGYFCGGVLRKGPFKILGSPLKGWGTNYLGPVYGDGFDTRAFLLALDELARDEGFAMVELEGRGLQAAEMESAGYVAVDQHTYVIELLPGDPERMLRRLHPKARKAVRLAKGFGLKVEDTDEPAVATEVYDQYTEILARKKLYPTFDETVPKVLLRALKPLDQLFALRVRHPEGQVLAVGLFPHDDRTLYFSFTGSRIAGWNLFPNDLLQWSAMEMAARRGLTVYNMCGYGYFKSKFGGTLQHPQRWHKCYSQGAVWARRGYEAYFKNRTRIRGWLENAARRRSRA